MTMLLVSRQQPNGLAYCNLDHGVQSLTMSLPGERPVGAGEQGREISFAQVLMRLFRVAQRFDVEIQPQMILLHKTLFNIEGLGRELYPQLDLWKTAHPVLKRWMNEQVGPKAIFADLRELLPQLRDALRELPDLLRKIAKLLDRPQSDEQGN